MGHCILVAVSRLFVSVLSLYKNDKSAPAPTSSPIHALSLSQLRASHYGRPQVSKTRHVAPSLARERHATFDVPLKCVHTATRPLYQTSKTHSIALFQTAPRCKSFPSCSDMPRLLQNPQGYHHIQPGRRRLQTKMQSMESQKCQSSNRVKFRAMGPLDQSRRRRRAQQNLG